MSESHPAQILSHYYVDPENQELKTVKSPSVVSGDLDAVNALYKNKSILDSFAEAALTGLLHKHAYSQSHELAQRAYDIAEEMLAEKKKREAK